MIGRLSGILIQKQAPKILLDVNGVGYELEAPMTTFYDLPEVGSEVVLMTHLIVREDAHLLYGFISEANRKLFRGLIKISGIGAKLALAILSSMDSDVFVKCIVDQDVSMLTTIPGIGKKSAERLLIEMRDRLDKLGLNTGELNTSKSSTSYSQSISAFDDAVGALIALGYKAQDASKWVKSAQSECDEGVGSEVLIKTALRALNK